MEEFSFCGTPTRWRRCATVSVSKPCRINAICFVQQCGKCDGSRLIGCAESRAEKWFTRESLFGWELNSRSSGWGRRADRLIYSYAKYANRSTNLFFCEILKLFIRKCKISTYSSLKLPFGVSGWVRPEDVPWIADHHRWLWYATPAQVKSKFSMLGTCKPKWNGRFCTRKNKRNNVKLANTESESSVIRRFLCNRWVMFYARNNVFWGYVSAMFATRTNDSKWRNLN